MKLHTFWLLAVIGAIGSPAPAQAPLSTGSIQGSLVDSTGAAVAEARVRVVNKASGLARIATSDETGQFRVGGLPDGSYSLSLEREGFAPVSMDGFSISVGQTVVQRVEMKPARVIEKVEAQGQPDALEATATMAAATLGGDRIEEAPASNRNHLNFVLIAPGAASSAGSNAQRSMAGARSAAPDSGFSFSGMRTDCGDRGRTGDSI